MIKLAIFGCRSIHGTLLHLLVDQIKDEGVIVAVCGGHLDHNEIYSTAETLSTRNFAIAEGDQIIHHRAMLNEIMARNNINPEETVVISMYPLDREAGEGLGCAVRSPTSIEMIIRQGSIGLFLRET